MTDNKAKTPDNNMTVSPSPDYALVQKSIGNALRSSGVTYPIDAKNLAEIHGLTVTFSQFPESYKSKVNGILDFVNARIFVNADIPTEYQNFAIAHELGHWLMHKEKQKEYNDYSIMLMFSEGVQEYPNAEMSVMEKEANLFATNLLAPLQMIMNYKAMGVPNKSISKALLVPEEIISKVFNGLYNR